MAIGKQPIFTKEDNIELEKKRLGNFEDMIDILENKADLTKQYSEIWVCFL